MIRLPMSKTTLSIVVVLVPLVLLLGFVALRSGPLAPVAVTVTQVEAQSLQPALFGVGHVEARQLHPIGPTAPGRLLALTVDVGDEVQAGQVLGRMDPVDSDDRIRAQEAVVQRATAVRSEASARAAHATLQANRYEALYAEQATSEELLSARRQELQVARAALAAAEHELSRAAADLRALQAQRNQLRLVSPIKGVVVARAAEPGATAVAGQTVVEVMDPQSLWVHARFDQVSAHGLVAGLPAKVVLRSRRGEPVEGRVYRTELRADAVTEEMLAKVVLVGRQGPMPPLGERAEVTVQLPALPQGPVIPNAAIHRQGQHVGVWKPQGDGLAFVPVKLGRTDLEGRVQVLEGLQPGESIVLHSEKALKADTTIQVVDRMAGVAP